MRRRTFVAPALLLAALTVVACGGGGSGAEGKIVETIEKAVTTSKPANCTKLVTQRFNEQNTARKGEAAVKACEAEAKSGEGKAKGAKVSNVAVNGAKATAEVEFEGGSLGGQSLEVALVEAGGNWKLDHVEGFAGYDGKALAKAFEKQFEEEPGELSPKQARCISAKIAGASQAEAEELFFSGSRAPIVELAESCA
ncbi:MAG: hypothetical protein JSU06_11130 [Actinobacteria bacterium]|nr:hypothetical protein [Actinomycetota bacterium]